MSDQDPKFTKRFERTFAIDMPFADPPDVLPDLLEPTRRLGFDEYQREAGVTATNIPDRELELLVRVMKLCSEAGELADVVGSSIEGSKVGTREDARERVKGELGDVLWYAARIAALYDLNFQDVAQANLEKVRARNAAGYWGEVMKPGLERIEGKE